VKQKKSNKFKVISTPKRSFAKAIVFRILATLTTVFIIFVFTGSLFLTIGIGIIDVISKLILYYLHERMWGAIDWGRTSYRIKKNKKVYLVKQ